MSAPSILLRMDEDPAGEVAVKQINSLSCAVKRINVPKGKDINDFYMLANHGIVYEWITSITRMDNR